MYTNSTPEAFVLSARYYLVIELNCNGLVFYTATDYVRPVSSSTGETICIDAILESSPEVSLSEGWGESENEPPQVSFNLPLTGLVLDLKNQNLLNGSQIGVYLWAEGQDWDSKELLCSGRLEYTADDGDSGTLSCVVIQRLDEASGVLPLLTDRVPLSTISLLERQQFLPFVFGAAPDRSYPVTIRPYPFKAELYTGLGEGQKVYSVLLAKGFQSPDTVNMVCTDPALANNNADVSVVLRSDVAPNISIVKLVTAPLGPGSDEWGLSYYYHTSGVAMGFYRSRPLRGLGSLCASLLEGSGLALDYARINSFEEPLNSYSVAGQIDEPTNCLQYLRDAVTGTFPVTLMQGANGCWVQPWRSLIQSDIGQAFLDPEDGSCSRSSPVSRDSKDVINDLTIFAGYCRLRGIYTLQYALAAGRGTNQSNQIVRKSPTCVMSQDVYGAKVEERESVILYDLGSVGLVLEQVIEAKAFPKARVSYDLPPSMAWVRPGTLLEVYDREVRLSGLGLVDRLLLSETGPTVELVMLRETPTSFEERASVISPF